MRRSRRVPLPACPAVRWAPCLFCHRAVSLGTSTLGTPATKARVAFVYLTAGTGSEGHPVLAPPVVSLPATFPLPLQPPPCGAHSPPCRTDQNCHPAMAHRSEQIFPTPFFQMPAILPEPARLFPCAGSRRRAGISMIWEGLPQASGRRWRRAFSSPHVLFPFL